MSSPIAMQQRSRNETESVQYYVVSCVLETCVVETEFLNRRQRGLTKVIARRADLDDHQVNELIFGGRGSNLVSFSAV